LIHRDIKPGNILLLEGHAVVTDFGVVRAVSEAGGDRVTATGIVLGTPAYMSPEPETGLRPSSVPRRQLRARTLIGIALVAALAIGAWLWSRGQIGEEVALDPNLVAVAPFDVLDEGLDVWSEGMVDYLSGSLDGAGSLRTVAPTTTIRRWSGRVDKMSAAALGRATGAGLVVFGGLLRTGSDSVRVKTSVYDVEADAVLGELDLRGPAARLDVLLIDSVTVGLLAELARRRPIGSRPGAYLGASSLPALKVFLRGEQQIRRANFDSAALYYRRAVELDSTFALAYAGVADAIGWRESAYDPEVVEFGLRAAALNHGLPRRDSLLIAADSLFWSLSGGIFIVGANDFARVRRLFSTLELAVEQYSDDPGVWDSFAEALIHWGFYTGVSRRRALDAFRTAIRLDPGYAPAYGHLVPLTLRFEGAAAARREAGAHLILDPAGDKAVGIRLIRLLLDPDSVKAPQTQRVLETASAEALATAALAFLWHPDSSESAVGLARLLAEGRPGSPLWSAPSSGQFLLVAALLSRGHAAEAARLNDPGLIFHRLHFLAATFLGGVQDVDAQEAFRAWLDEGDPAVLSSLWWSAERRDTAFIKQAITAEYRSARAVPFRLPFSLEAAPAFLELARGDTSLALERFLAVPDSLCMDCLFVRLTRARLLGAAGRDEEAAELLDEPFSNMSPVLEASWALERGRVNERLGDRATAREAYGYVVEAWRASDSGLQPYVEEARAALKRMGNEPPP